MFLMGETRLVKGLFLFERFWFVNGAAFRRC